MRVFESEYDFSFITKPVIETRRLSLNEERESVEEIFIGWEKRRKRKRMKIKINEMKRERSFILYFHNAYI